MVEGKIPKDINGQYLRNGPNPKFLPIHYVYPYDGDGMIHQLKINNGKVSYRNRFVKTQGLVAEEKAQEALYGSLMRPIRPDPKYFDSFFDAMVPVKNVANINVANISGSIVAFYEGMPAYELDSELKTKGLWKPKGLKKAPVVNAHFRRDPVNNDYWFMNYSIYDGSISFLQVDQESRFVRKHHTVRQGPTMIHDFMVTKKYIVFIDTPAYFNYLNSKKSDEEKLLWRPDQGTNIILLDKKTGKKIVYKAEPIFLWHIANAYEENNELNLEFVMYDEPFNSNKHQTSNRNSDYLHINLDLNSGEIFYNKGISSRLEFPALNPSFYGKKHNYVYAIKKAENNNGYYNSITKINTKKQSEEIYNFGKDFEVGEASFVPKEGFIREDDGYLVLFANHRQSKKAEFVIFDARSLKQGPLARIHIPTRVPNGLHGSWVSNK